MGYKSRLTYAVPFCVKDCTNRELECEGCFNSDKFIRRKDVESNRTDRQRALQSG